MSDEFCLPPPDATAITSLAVIETEQPSKRTGKKYERVFIVITLQNSTAFFLWFCFIWGCVCVRAHSVFY